MSHLAKLGTQIRSLEIARLALDALGVPVAEHTKHVNVYYAAANGGRTPVDLVIGRDTWSYNLGLQLQPDGTYSLVGDNYDMASMFAPQGQGANGTEVLLALGPTMLQWEWRTVGGIGGHWMNGTPTHFLREYAAQTGLVMAATYGMSAERLPADPAEDDAEPGDEKLILTGGYLPPHMRMILIARNDGTCSVRFEGSTDTSCYEYTKPLEDALGALLVDTPTLNALDTVHVQQRHVARN